MNTLDKFLDCYRTQTIICSLCKRLREDHEHLSFKCPYFRSIWKKMMKHLKCTGWNYEWKHTLQWLNTNHSWKTRCQRNVALLGFLVVLYHIWKERNARLYNNEAKNHNFVIKDVLLCISQAVDTWRSYKLSKFHWGLALNLGITMKIFTPHLPSRGNTLV